MKEKEALEFVNEKTEKLKLLIRKVGLAYFNAITSGKEEFYKEYEKMQMEIEKMFNNKDDFEKIKKLYKVELKDNLLKREIILLKNFYLGSQGDIKIIEKIVKLSAELEKKFNTFRAEIDGKKMSDNEIKKILKTETNNKKTEEAWSASKKQGRLVFKDLICLVKLRNNLAKSLGFENYYKFSLEIHEQSEEEIEKIFREIEEKTNEAFKKVKESIDNFLSKKFSINKSELRPWHYQDLFFQEAPEIYSINLDKYYNKDIIEISKKFYNSIGLDILSILEKSDLYEGEGKYQHACCMDIDREGDIRSVMNIKNNLYWMTTILHEFGHGIYWKYINKNFPFLIRDTSHTFITEAIANFFEREARNINFIKRYSEIRLNKRELKKLNEKIKKELILEKLVYCRWSLVMFNFERELYKNPEQNLNKLWWKMVKKYQMIDFSRDEPDWASKIHLVSSPVYYHNYLLGRILASQIHNYIIKNILKEQKLGDYDYSENKKIGDYLIEKIFSVGASLRWDELIKRATGEELTSGYCIEQFVG